MIINSQALYAQSSIQISKNDTSIKLDKHAYIVDDVEGKMTVRDIISDYKNGKIRQKNQDSYIFLKPEPQWVVIPIENLSIQTEWLLDFGDLTTGRTGIIDQMLVYESSQRKIFYNGLDGRQEKNPHIIENRYLPITIPNQTNAVFILYFHPSDYKQSVLPLTIHSKISKSSMEYTINRFIIENTSSIIMASIVIIMIGFFITNAPGFIPIAIYYLSTLLWFLFAETPLLHNIIGINIMAPLIPITMGLLIATTCFFTVPVRYSSPIFRTALLFLIIIAIGVFILFAIGNSINVNSKYLISHLISALIFIFSIFFLQKNASHHLKKSNLFLSLWIGMALIGQIFIAIENINIIPHYFMFYQADKIALYFQFILVFIGIIISIRAEHERRLVNHIRLNQKTTSILNAQKNKENSDHSRLLRVIEREREIMEELRARETERTEEMRNAKIVADEANQAKSAFLAVVSHEIRTPMTGIMGMVKMLEDTSLSDEQKDYIMTIGDSGQAMLALLNDILDFSKIEDGAMDLENIEFDLRRVLNSVTMLMKAHSDQKNLQLILNIDDDIPQALYGDPTRLRQIILNLVGNAIKFTSKGHVAIIANYDGNGQDVHNVQFEVSDTGLGISKEAQENLFTPFAQADSSISRRYGGTGLGLAICKTLVEAMGGTIGIKSREGAGSTFHFELPFTSEFIKKPTEKQTNEIVEDLRLMVVDDNEINRKVIDGFLKKYNHTVVLLESGKDALDILETDQKFDALFLDIEMPGMSGIDLAQHIKQDASIKNIPLIAITGNVSDDDISRYKNAGFSDHVAKPIEIEELNRAIAQTQASPAPQKDVVDNIPQKIKITPSKKSSEKKALKPAVGKTLDEVMLKGLKEGLGSKQTNDLIAELFIKADEIVGQLIDLKETEDKDSARMRAHELKGMAGNFGLKALSDKSDEIEQICKDSDRPFTDIIPHIEDLSTLVERSRYAVKEFLGD